MKDKSKLTIEILEKGNGLKLTTKGKGKSLDIVNMLKNILVHTVPGVVIETID